MRCNPIQPDSLSLVFWAFSVPWTVPVQPIIQPVPNYQDALARDISSALWKNFLLNSIHVDVAIDGGAYAESDH